MWTYQGEGVLPNIHITSLALFSKIVHKGGSNMSKKTVHMVYELSLALGLSYCCLPLPKQCSRCSFVSCSAGNCFLDMLKSISLKKATYKNPSLKETRHFKIIKIAKRNVCLRYYLPGFISFCF